MANTCFNLKKTHTQSGLYSSIYGCITGLRGLTWWLSGKESACNAGDPGLIPASERSPGKGNGSPLQYSCLENSMDRGV